MPDVKAATQRWRRAWLAALLVVPVAIVVGAYAWMSVAHGTPVLWNVVVHESGKYTFGETTLFVRHYLREIPVDIVMALALATAITTASPETRTVRSWWPAALAAAIALIAFVASSAQEGAVEAIRDVLQFRTRDDDVSFGSHWRFHLLSTLWFANAAFVLVSITSGSVRLLRPTGRARTFALVTWGLILVLTVGFVPSMEPFTSARYIGHQAREILTHGLITLPFVFALGVKYWLNDREGLSVGREGQHTGVALSAAVWFMVVAIPVFLIAAFSGAELEETAQLSSGLSGIVAAHVFEHALDYAFVIALTAALVGRPKA